MIDNEIRPYSLDYFIPKKHSTGYDQGMRDVWFKTQNAIIYTLLRQREERKNKSIFDRIYERVMKEKEAEEDIFERL